MGSSSSKTSNQSQQQQQSQSTTTGSNTGSATTTANVPEWLQTPAQNFASNIGALQGNSSQFTPTASAGQQQAYGSAANLVDPQYGVAKSTLTGLPDVQAQSVLTGLSNYYNPFEDQIVNPVLNAYDAQAAQTTAQQAAQAAKGQAFQGSRYGIQEAQTAQDLAQGRASTQGGLLNQMYTQAASMSEADAQRRQAAAVQNQTADLQKAQELASIRTAQSDQARANAGAQLTAGQDQYATDNATRNAPITTQAQLEGLLQGLDPSMYAGSSVNTSGTSTASNTSSGTSSGTASGKTSSNPGLLANLGQAVQIGGAFLAL
jgi:hypothetical protein